MERLHYSVEIKAPKEKVWNIMLEEDSYKKWTEVFAAGSHYKGDWRKGSKILFLAPGKSGKMEGMVSRIKENIPFEYLSIEHLGIVHDEKEDTESEAVKGWNGALENYTLKEQNGKTEVFVELDSIDEFKEMFEDVWPKALQKLKAISEK